MVFTRLSLQEKEAFFGLLDEYFQSRPELFGQRDGQGAGGALSSAAAASVMQRALTAGGASTPGTRSNNPYAASMPNVDVGHAVSVGKVAAASLAFSGPHASASASTDPSRRASDAPKPGAEVDKLVTAKTSVLSAFRKQTPPGAVTIPSAFAVPKNTYGPPPVRRVTSETAGGARPVPGKPEPEVSGEWAEVLYDYSSEDPGDLAIEAGTRVLITAKSSDDWWEGQTEGQGRKGLFPASYVKLL